MRSVEVVGVTVNRRIDQLAAMLKRRLDSHCAYGLVDQRRLSTAQVDRTVHDAPPAQSPMAIIECIPNISEGRRPEVVAGIADRLRAHSRRPRCSTSSPTPPHHRSVLTFAGDAAGR